MTRAWLGMVALTMAAACGRTEREPFEPPTTAAGSAGEGSGGTSSGGSASAGDANANGLAGLGGAWQVDSAVTECQRYCETPYNRLPQALCEDWNRPEWDPPFCHMDTTTSCADYCAQVYQTVTPECGELLAPVIRCVAPVYARGEINSCFLGECYRELFALTTACYGLRTTLADARATWQASGVVDYQLTYTAPDNTQAQVVVRAGLDPVVTPANVTVWTVPLLFDAAEHSLDGFGLPRITYDSDLGYVVSLSILESCDQALWAVRGVEVAPFR